MFLLLACSDYEYASKLAHDGDSSSDHGWSWDEDDFTATDVEEVVDNFVVEGSRAADFVFFGDTSGSMTEELITLGGKMEEFVGLLSAAETDWQLAAVTGPSGCIVGDIYDPWTEGVAAAFSAAILTPPGEDLVDEWGLYNVAHVVDNSDAGECNEGLIRGNASLHAVFLSDENDDSPGSADGDPDYWQTYVDQLVARKGSAAAVTLSAIAGPVPEGCSGADPGYGYWEATQATGGEFISLCEDWPDAVDLLATAAVTESRFPLSAVPRIETLEVQVDGVLDTTDWVYDSAGNYVEFVQDLPTSGQVVRIHYITLD